MPAQASIPGEFLMHSCNANGMHTQQRLLFIAAVDGSTPLHLACRRACHLAPEGNGGMGTYDVADIRMLADVAGSGVLTVADDEGRTP